VLNWPGYKALNRLKEAIKKKSTAEATTSWQVETANQFKIKLAATWTEC